MATELQSLLDKIQSDGVDKAQEETKAIIDNAEKKAKEIVSEAEKKRDEFMKKAEEEANVLRERSEQSIKQAARDVVLEVGESIQATLERVLLKDLDASLSGDFMQTFLSGIVTALANDPNAAGGMEVFVPEDQAEKLTKFAQAGLSRAVAGGLKILPGKNVNAGIRVMMSGGRIEHDFTDKAIMDAMSGILRPALSKMIFDK